MKVIKTWKRKCQECNNIQLDTTPPIENEKKMDVWLEHKCKRCGSIALNYGDEK